jgi:hypothetical protein
LRGGHGDHAALAADLTAFPPHSRHISRKVSRVRRDGQGRRGFGGRPINDPFGKLVCVSRSFSFADGHGRIIAHNTILVATALRGLDNGGMEKIPRELNWVKERAGCTIKQMFSLLHQAVEEDVKIINQTGKFPEYYAFVAILSQDGESFSVRRADTTRPFVRFSMAGDIIKVTDDAGIRRLEYRIVLSDEGRCQLTENGTPLEQWQVRKAALEGLFFPASI